jgi:hypothetical protein
VNTEVEEATALEAITRQQLVMIQQTEKTPYVNCSVYELELVI